MTFPLRHMLATLAVAALAIAATVPLSPPSPVLAAPAAAPEGTEDEEEIYTTPPDLSDGAAAPEGTEDEEEIYTTPPDLSDGAAAPEPVAAAWVVADLDAGDIYAERGPDTQRAPASVIKLLTALALVDVLDDPDEEYEAVYEDMTIDGTKVGLMQQNDYSIDNLFHALLMSSANDAAHALGNAVGGQDEAVELMNAKAAELGLTGTVARNTSGLDADGQVTTVIDQLIIARAVLADDYLMSIIGTEVYDFPGATNPDTDEKIAGYEIQNHTDIAGDVPGGLGLKNGYTRAAKGSFVAVIERDGRTFAAALLDSDNGTRQAAIDLIDWAAAQSDPTPVRTVDLAPAPEPSTEAPDAEESASGVGAGGAADAEDPAAEAPEANAGSADSSSASVAGPVMLLGLAAAILVAGIVAWFLLRRRQSHERSSHADDL